MAAAMNTNNTTRPKNVRAGHSTPKKGIAAKQSIDAINQILFVVSSISLSTHQKHINQKKGQGILGPPITLASYEE